MLQDFSKTSPVMAEAQGSAQEYVQGSGAWHGARLGCVTASRVADVVAKTKSGYSAARQTYMGQLLSERLTGLPTETFQNAAMRWGVETEAEAVDAVGDVAVSVRVEPVRGPCGHGVHGGGVGEVPVDEADRGRVPRGVERSNV